MPAAVESRKRAAPGGQDPRGSGGGASSSRDAGAKRQRLTMASVEYYERLDSVGEGAFGVVFEARHRRSGDTVALKWLRREGGGHGPPDFDAMRVEAACHHQCRGHPHIVEARDVVGDPETGDVFLVIEFVPGGLTLRHDIWRVTPEEIVRVRMHQLLGAAKKMHASRVIHRDLKPENVLVTPFGRLKICDFGCATPMKPAGKPYDECLVGTVAYMSPELLAENRHYGPAVDMWSMGCVMGELLTGCPLFAADASSHTHLLAVLSDHLEERLRELFEELVPELSEAGRDILAGLLAFDPEKRLTAEDALRHRWFEALPSWMIRRAEAE